MEKVKASVVISKSFKLLAPVVGNVVGGPVAGALGALVGAAAEEMTGDFFDGIGDKIAGISHDLIDRELRDKFAHAVKGALTSTVNSVIEDNRAEIEKLPEKSRKWLERRLKRFSNIKTWEKLNSFVPRDFDTFEEYYFEPIRKFLSQRKPESIDGGLIEKLANDLANRSLDAITEAVAADKSMVILNTIFTIYTRLYARAGIAPQSLEKRFKSEREAVKNWVLEQMAIMREHVDARIDKIEFRLYRVEKKVEDIDERMAALEHGMAASLEPQLGGWHGLPFINMETAVDRPELMSELREILNGRKQIAVVGLHGMGGIGKTFIVRLFIEREKETIKERFPHGVIWVSAGEKETAESIAARALSYIYDSIAWISNKLAKLQQVLANNRLLLVIDSAENIKGGIRELLFDPQDSRIIFTTRRAIHEVPKIDVDVMEMDEAIELFKRILGDTVDAQREEFEKLAAALGRLPLAIEIVAKRMRKHGWSPSYTLEKFHEARTELIKLGRGETKETNIEASFELSFKEFEEPENEFERDVLFALSVFSQMGGTEEELAGVLEVNADDMRLSNALESLEELSLVRPRRVEDMTFWSMHPLLREFVRSKAKAAGKLEKLSYRFAKVMLESAVSWYVETQKTAEEGYSPEKHAGAIHFAVLERDNLFEALSVASELYAVDIALYVAPLFGEAGMFDDELEVLKRAEKLTKSILELANLISNVSISASKKRGRRVKDPSKPIKEKVATIYINLGLAYDSKGEYDRVIEYFEKALEILRDVFGEMHPEMAIIYDHLGKAYASEGDYDSAIKYYKKMLEIELKASGGDSSQIAKGYDNLGKAYFFKGDYDKALEFYEKSLETKKKVLGELHPDTAVTYNNIGMVYQIVGDYNKAIEYHEKALEIVKDVLGEKHSSAATTYSNLGAIYYFKGKYGKAIEYLNKALEIKKELLGEAHPDMATTYNNLGKVYQAIGDYDRAIDFYKKSLKIKKNAIGDKHSEIADIYNVIGEAYRSRGDYDKAIRYYRKALEIDLKVLEGDHPELARDYNNLGSVYHSKGNYDGAIRYFKKALEIFRNVFGEMDPNTAATYNNIGSAYFSKGEYDRAIEYYSKALEIRKNVLGETHPQTAATYSNIGSAYYSLGEHKKAIEYLNRALEIKKKVLGEAHPDTAITYNNLGMVYQAIGDYEKAIDHYEKALEIRRNILGDGHPDMANSYNNIGGAYASMGNYDKAIEYFEKALRILKPLLGECHPYTRIVVSNILSLYSDESYMNSFFLKDERKLANVMRKIEDYLELEKRCGG